MALVNSIFQDPTLKKTAAKRGRMEAERGMDHLREFLVQTRNDIDI